MTKIYTKKLIISKTESCIFLYYTKRFTKKNLGKIVGTVMECLEVQNGNAFLLKFTKVLLKSKWLDSVEVSSGVGTVVIPRM